MTQPLLIIKTKSGFAAVALPADVVAAMSIPLTELECFESLGGRYSSGGVIDAVTDHFRQQPEQTTRPDHVELKAA